MKALILAAGFATRLYPLTTDVPKALLEIQGKAIVQDVFDQITELFPQHNSIALVTNHHYAQAFQDWLQTHDFKHQVELLDNGVTTPQTRLGAIGDLAFAIKSLNWEHEDLLVVASDTLASVRLRDMINTFTEQPAVITAVFDVQDTHQIANRLGCVTVSGKHILKFEEKPAFPRSTFVSIPFYIFPKHSHALIQQYQQEKHSLDAPGSLLAWIITKTPVIAQIDKDGYYYDVGTPEDLLKLQTKGIQHLPHSAI